MGNRVDETKRIDARIEGRTPPHDLEAEAAVLSSAMLDPSAMAKLADLKPEHFYSEAHRRIFEACCELTKAERPVDVLQVQTWLRDRGRLAQIGGSGYLTEVLDAAPFVTNVEAYARGLRDKARVRNVILTCQRIAATGYADFRGDASSYLADAREQLAGLAATDTESWWYRLEHAAELAAPQPPVAWLCRSLRLARESVTILGGYGYARKTLLAQDLALSISTGRNALGVFDVAQAHAVHIDYEQGARITRERYQRMARVACVDLREAWLSVATFPRLRLTSVGARDVLRRLLEESRAGLLVIDSLRAAVSGVDENSSEIREHVDLVGQECKRVGAAAVIIHHARKPSETASGARYSLRGSGAIFDAVDELFMLSGEKGEHTTVQHEKDRLQGNELAAFGLDSEDVARDGDSRWGLRLVHMEPEQLRELESRQAARREEAKEARSRSRNNGGSAAPAPESVGGPTR